MRLAIRMLAALALAGPAGAEITQVHSQASLEAKAIARDDLGEGSETVVVELLPGEGYSLPLAPDVAVEIRDAKTKK